MLKPKGQERHQTSNHILFMKTQQSRKELPCLQQGTTSDHGSPQKMESLSWRSEGWNTHHYRS